MNTKTLEQLKKEKSEAINKLFSDCGVFFAFSDKQFEEGKTKCQIHAGEKLASVGGGGFVRLEKADELKAGVDSILAKYNEDVKAFGLRKDLIRYELFNHEAFYTYDITSTVEALGEGFTREEVAEVFNSIKDTVH